jgi:hypothetical protein
MRRLPDTVTYRYIGATAPAHDGWESIGDLGHTWTPRATSASPTGATT